MTTVTPSFVVGGPVPLDSPSYIVRPFEGELFSAVTSGDWVVLLGPRQHGKTSALTRAYRELSDNGFGCAFIDLQAYGADSSYGHFLRWLSRTIAKEIGGTGLNSDSAEELEDVLQRTLPDRPASIVLFLDECSALPEAWRRRFFGQLRALFNARARASAGDVPLRITCVFAGTFRSEDMIEGENSPFNVSTFITATNFDRDDVASLASTGAQALTAETVDRVYELTQGQPYLTQLLLANADRLSEEGAEELLDPTLTRLHTGDDRHLSNLVKRLQQDDGVLGLVPGLLGGRLQFDGTNTNHLFAQTLGVARVMDGALVPANPLYAEVLAGLEDAPATAAKISEAAPSCDVLLVTANDIETTAVREVFGGDGDLVSVDSNTYFDLGSVNGLQVVNVRCPDMGSVGSAASILVVSDALSDLEPQVVVSVGVAFGLWPDDQGVGTLLIADEVIAYEPGRIGTDAAGDESRIARGPHYNLDPGLHGRLQELALGQGIPAEFGKLLSGEKLVDNVEFRDSVRDIEPEARGGEMEAAGVCAASERARIPWIIAKAICDFADGNKNVEKSFNQKRAADNSVEFVRFALESGVLIKPRSL